MSAVASTLCGPCSREGKSVSSPTRFCVNCNDTLCDACAKQHQKFTSTRNHTFVKEPPKRQTATPSSSTSSFGDSLLFCTKHVGKYLESYCSIHNDVCCNVCIAVDHSSCRRPDDHGIVAIETVARNISESNDFVQIRDRVGSVVSEALVLKSKREKNLLHLSEKKNEIIHTINDFTAEMKDRLTVLERTTQTELGDVYVNTAIEVENDIQLCDDVMQSLQASPILHSKDISLNDSELFIHMKRTEKQLTDGKKIIDTVSENVDKEVLEFKLDTTLEKHLTKLDRFGKFKIAHHCYTGILIGEYNISLRFEAGQKHDIIDSCVLADGRLAIIHGTEKKIKLLDRAYKIADQLDLPGKPFGVCVVSDHELIVSMKDGKYLQFINISGKPKLGNIIKVGVECYGIAYCEGELFVACGGGVYEAKPQLRVYNANGVLIRIVEKGADGKQIFSKPRNLALNPEGTVVFISDTDRGIVSFDIKKSIISGFWHRDLKSPRGIVVDSNGNVIVCGHHSHNVIQFTPGGKIVYTILTEKDGISFPLSFCLTSEKLVVTSDRSKFLKVYALSKK